MNWSPRSVFLGGGLFLGLGLGAAPNGLAEVPDDHWAKGAVREVRAQGYLDHAEGRFEGERVVNRYETAVVVDRILSQEDAAQPASGGEHEGAAEMKADLSATSARVDRLESAEAELAERVDRLKVGSFSATPRKPLFGGVMAAALVATDDGSPAGSTPFLTRYGGTSGQEFFTLPRMSLTMDRTGDRRWGYFMQFDYQTDRSSRGLLAAGSGVGLGEAYVTYRPEASQWSLKLGGFATGFSSWEVDGPARTLTRTITPSVVNTFFETLRFVGAEGTRRFGDTTLRAAIYNGAELGITGTPPRLLGNLSDVTGLGQISRASSRDDRPGFYLDLEHEFRPGLVARAGYIDLGGDFGVQAPLRKTLDITGLHAGVTASRGSWELAIQALDLHTEQGTGVATQGDHRALSAGLTYRLSDRDRVTVRYDDWENEVSTSPTSGLAGSAWTAAWSRRYRNGSLLQAEWISPDEEFINAASFDHRDDQLQLRYTVVF